jgi:hypothetical protein
MVVELLRVEAIELRRGLVFGGESGHDVHGHGKRRLVLINTRSFTLSSFACNGHLY